MISKLIVIGPAEVYISFLECGKIVGIQKNRVMQPIQPTLIKRLWVPGLVLHEVAHKTELLSQVL